MTSRVTTPSPRSTDPTCLSWQVRNAMGTLLALADKHILRLGALGRFQSNLIRRSTANHIYHKYIYIYI